MSPPSEFDDTQHAIADLVQTEALNPSGARLNADNVQDTSQLADTEGLACDVPTDPSSTLPGTTDTASEDRSVPAEQSEQDCHFRRAPPASRPWFENHDEYLAAVTEQVLDITESDLLEGYRLRRRTKKSYSKTFDKKCAKGDIWFTITQRPEIGDVMALKFVCEGKPAVALGFPLNAVHGVDLADNDVFEQIGLVLERLFNGFECDQPHSACLWRLMDWTLAYFGGHFSLLQIPQWTDKQAWLVRIHYTNYLTGKIETFDYTLCKGMTFAKTFPPIPAQRVFHKGSYGKLTYFKCRVVNGQAIWPSALPKNAIRPTDQSGKTYSEASLKNTEYFMRYLVHYLSHTRSSHEQMIHTITHLEGYFTGNHAAQALIERSHFMTGRSMFALVGVEENRRTRVCAAAQYRDVLYLSPDNNNLCLHELAGHPVKYGRLLSHLYAVYLRRFDGRETIQELDRLIEEYRAAKARKQADARLLQEDQADGKHAKQFIEDIITPEAVAIITATEQDGSSSMTLQVKQNSVGREHKEADSAENS